MLITENTAALRQQIREWKQAGDTIAFVPTMGNLHQGHLTLVEKARQNAERVVVSIFVNPMQFNNSQDLENYPRTLEQDQLKLQDAGADLLFTPDASLIYPKGSENHTFVEVPGLSELLEGALRPGHFRGVSTIVTKLFNLVQPDIACFGQKDYQQLALIRTMTEDLALPIEIIGVPTVRAEDGLALSSRNTLLTAEQRELAPQLARVMRNISKELAAERQAEPLAKQAADTLDSLGFKTDAIDIVDARTLEPLQPTSQQAVILMAAYLGEVRLIDNMVVDLCPQNEL
ncbi:pantoate--beta-alanine ligase [Dongshaea marina]|uniref:pantoate--beta-alanine ligase n=1 Tax=Dongshaea marina TaxID=2047966 RepID=UPI000D3E3679|nr:pantoate--beta-alanine ligase [Dongshaea marina]